jgi:hypothetical protein
MVAVGAREEGLIRIWNVSDKSDKSNLSQVKLDSKHAIFSPPLDTLHTSSPTSTHIKSDKCDKSTAHYHKECVRLSLSRSLFTNSSLFLSLSLSLSLFSGATACS